MISFTVQNLSLQKELETQKVLKIKVCQAGTHFFKGCQSFFSFLIC